eukprot:TRINITY_DN9753_c0_g1_i1.p1 TRINITY_DN9753_c0_g1~~TRINITY_DN9753_c0_g1_i1.p1  ORF type:complete len:476 (-),score=56.85 TRINITY_DN9753_c0_g1_i1:156-1583(-)
MTLRATTAIRSVARAMASKLLPHTGVVVASFSSSPASYKLGTSRLPCPLQRRRRRNVFAAPAPSLRRQCIVTTTASMAQPGQQAPLNGEQPGQQAPFDGGQRYNSGPRPQANRGPPTNRPPRREKLPPLYPFDDRFPITVITGWKGSGKTTTMNAICNSKPYLKVAVIINELGEVIIDDSAVTAIQTAPDEIVDLKSQDKTKSVPIREDLVCQLAELLEKKKSRRVHFDHILVETTELAPVSPIFNTFHVESAVAARVRIDSIVAIVDAEHALRRFDEVKADGGPNDQAAQIGFADRIIVNKIDLVGEAEQEEIIRRIKRINFIAEIHKTARGIVDIEFVFGGKTFDKRRIIEYMEKLFPTPPPVFDTQPLPSHGVSSFKIFTEGEVDLEKINDWVMAFILQNKENCYRYKGVLAIKGYESVYVFQGLSGHYEGFPDRAWGDRERKFNKLFIIGRNLDQRAIRAGFDACLINRRR